MGAGSPRRRWGHARGRWLYVGEQGEAIGARDIGWSGSPTLEKSHVAYPCIPTSRGWPGSAQHPEPAKTFWLLLHTLPSPLASATRASDGYSARQVASKASGTPPGIEQSLESGRLAEPRRFKTASSTWTAPGKTALCSTDGSTSSIYCTGRPSTKCSHFPTDRKHNPPQKSRPSRPRFSSSAARSAARFPRGNRWRATRRMHLTISQLIAPSTLASRLGTQR